MYVHSTLHFAYIIPADSGHYFSPVGRYCYNAGIACKCVCVTTSLCYERCKKLKKAEKKKQTKVLIYPFN